MITRRLRNLAAGAPTALLLLAIAPSADTISAATIPIDGVTTKLTASDAAAADVFGNSVGIDGSVIVVGSPSDSDAGFRSGSAYVFEREGGTWAQTAKLTASDAAAGDVFGESVAVSGDTIVVGAYIDDDAGDMSGSAYVFERDGGTWVETAKLTASDGAEGDVFGQAVAISGNRIVVGAPGDDDLGSASGSAYVFHLEGSDWIQETKLTAIDGAPEDIFGYKLDIDGNVVVVGSPSDDDGGPSTGSAYVFEWDGTNWVHQAKLTASEPKPYDYLGLAVGVSGNGIVVGAPSEDSGGPYSRSAYVFELDGANWVERAKLVPSDAALGDYFAEAVAIDGDRILVGATGDDDVGRSSGAAYLFEWDGAKWVERLKMVPQGLTDRDSLGFSVAIDGSTAVASAPIDDDAGFGSGAVYVRLVAYCDGLPATIVGTDGDDTIQGTAGADVIAGLGGNDVIYGRGGDDVICGGGGDDEIHGNSGDDRIVGGAGDDVVNGGWGSDVVKGEDGNDWVAGGWGDGAVDIVAGGSGNDRVFGGDGDDFLWGGGGYDQLFGGEGDDVLQGNHRRDLLRGGPGNDILYGDQRNPNPANSDPAGDVLFGDEGDDQLFGQLGDDDLDGGPDTDACDGGPGTNTILDCEG